MLIKQILIKINFLKMVNPEFNLDSCTELSNLNHELFLENFEKAKPGSGSNLEHFYEC